MRVAYDGSGFRGFARNEGVATVQAALEDTLSQVLRHPAVVAVAGRTDAGVHARGQVVSFDADAAHFEPFALDRALNRMLAPLIAVDEVEAAAPDFDARLSCTGRTYRYHLLNRRVADPLTRNLTWHFPEPLDLDAMQEAADLILGSHDFSAFSKRNKSRPVESFVRQVRCADWSRAGTEAGGVLGFEITANAFTHQMVRSLVGLLVQIGRGRRRVDDMKATLLAGDRSAASSPAPPHGLVLWQAHYDGT